MRDSWFFRFFPPPKFLVKPYAGLDISDDALRVIEFEDGVEGLAVSKCDQVELPKGLIDGGDVNDENRLIGILSEFIKRNKISRAKVSLPEEKSYLFEVDVPSRDLKTVNQNIEFKLEENIPMAAADAIFDFDLLPENITNGKSRASVSAIGRVYVEKTIKLLNSAGISPISFEIVPRSVARSAVSRSNNETVLVLNVMNRKAGAYVVCGGTVCFSSTMGWNGQANPHKKSEKSLLIESLEKEVARVNAYWTSRPESFLPIAKIALIGRGAAKIEKPLKTSLAGAGVSVPIFVPDILSNISAKISPGESFSKEDMLEYAVAVGLALPR